MDSLPRALHVQPCLLYVDPICGESAHLPTVCAPLTGACAKGPHAKSGAFARAQMDRCYRVPQQNAPAMQLQPVQPSYPGAALPVVAHAVAVGQPFEQPVIAHAVPVTEAPQVLAQFQSVPVARVTRAATKP